MIQWWQSKPALHCGWCAAVKLPWFALLDERYAEPSMQRLRQTEIYVSQGQGQSCRGEVCAVGSGVQWATQKSLAFVLWGSRQGVE